MTDVTAEVLRAVGDAAAKDGEDEFAAYLYDWAADLEYEATSPGEIAFRTSTGEQTPPPHWHDLTEDSQAKWEAVAASVLRHDRERRKGAETPPDEPQSGRARSHHLLVSDLQAGVEASIQRHPAGKGRAGSTSGVNPQPLVGDDEASSHDKVIDDIADRKAMGLRKYGTVLHAENGRDHLWDAYEEALDLVCYLRTEIDRRGVQASPGRHYTV